MGVTGDGGVFDVVGLAGASHRVGGSLVGPWVWPVFVWKQVIGCDPWPAGSTLANRSFHETFHGLNRFAGCAPSFRSVTLKTSLHGVDITGFY